MKISIAMATYNGAKYLREQLDSFVAQTRLPDELVVCDDGSTDATMDILHDFAATAPFEVRVVRNEENLGYARNFEKALSLCAGDIIFLSDQDDVWFEKKLETVIGVFADDPKTLCTINDMVITDSNLSHSGVTLFDNFRVSGWGEHRLIAGCAVAVRRDLVQVIIPLPEQYAGHDGWIGDLSVSLGVRKFIADPLQYYRRHGDNVSQWVFYDPSGLSIVDVVARTGLTSPITSWAETLQRVTVQFDRIADRRAALKAMGLEPAVEYANQYLKEEVARFEGRIHLLSLPRYRRWVSVLGFWMRGGYRRFSGWKSAVKDMIRP